MDNGQRTEDNGRRTTGRYGHNVWLPFYMLLLKNVLTLRGRGNGSLRSSRSCCRMMAFVRKGWPQAQLTTCVRWVARRFVVSVGGAGAAFKSFYHLNGIWQKAGFIFIVSSPLFPLPPAVTPSLMWQQERHKTNHTKFVNVPCGAASLRAAPSSLQSIY